MTPHPAQLGYRMPAEWEPHRATWLAWPHHKGDWPGKFAPIPWVYVDIVRHLHRSEEVSLLVNDADAEAKARRQLTRGGVDLSRVRFFRIATDRAWVRDYGPLFVVDGKGGVGLTDWHFNAWAKYPNWQRDDAVPAQIGAALGLPVWPARHGARHVVLEGGSIEVSGAGLLLTTEECLLSDVQARNPDLTRADLEAALRNYLGATKVLWLGRGIVGDDTHGHIDDLARFVGPRTVVAAVETNPADENYVALQENWERLQGMTDVVGSRLDVVALPMPAPVGFAGQRLPASYANFYVANTCVLVPTFNDANDRAALGVLADLFPGRAVVGIHCGDLIWGLGALHCMTQQQPASS